MSGVWNNSGGSEGMRRIGRYLLNALTLLSLLLCAATAAFWIRSHWITDGISFERHVRYSEVTGAMLRFTIWTNDGVIIFTPQRHDLQRPDIVPHLAVKTAHRATEPG